MGEGGPASARTNSPHSRWAFVCNYKLVCDGLGRSLFPVSSWSPLFFLRGHQIASGWILCWKGVGGRERWGKEEREKERRGVGEGDAVVFVSQESAQFPLGPSVYFRPVRLLFFCPGNFFLSSSPQMSL